MKRTLKYVKIALLLGALAATLERMTKLTRKLRDNVINNA